jgi:hypothetical protein
MHRSDIQGAHFAVGLLSGDDESAEIQTIDRSDPPSRAHKNFFREERAVTQSFLIRHLGKHHLIHTEAADAAYFYGKVDSASESTEIPEHGAAVNRVEPYICSRRGGWRLIEKNGLGFANQRTTEN